MAVVLYLICFLSIILPRSVTCLPEPGKKKLIFVKGSEYGLFTKTMNNGSTIAITGQCTGFTGNINIEWRLKISPCAEFFSAIEEVNYKNVWNFQRSFELRGENVVACNQQIHLKDETNQRGFEYTPPANTTETADEENDTNDEIDTNDRTEEEEEEEKNVNNEDSKEVVEKTTKKKSESRSRRHSLRSNKDAGQEKSLVRVKRKETMHFPELVRVKRKDDDQDNNDSIEADDGGQPRSETRKKSTNAPVKTTKKTTQTATTKKPTEKSKDDQATKLKKKDLKTKKGDEKVTEKPAEKTHIEKVANQVCATRFDGVYLLIIKAFPIDTSNGDQTKEKPKQERKKKEATEGGTAADDTFKLTLTVEMKEKHGFLSASDWPLYPFYGCMSLLYVFFGAVWLVVSACQWRDLLRIQFWIGGVIALGMLEKAVFFSEYNNINITGETNASLTIFAELVSCVKRTLARILVIIVSMGFGIVKPRLGNALHRVLGVGALYFILAAIEGCFRSLHPKADPGRQQLLASIPLAVLDASICWWIFMSLVQTTRTLRIRRNVVKLSLYRHFTNTLIFAVLASVAYMIWSIKTHRFAKDGCITDWSELWLDEAFWHFLFSIVLLVIMVLWRPTANNQRYAFTPLVDFGDDDDDDNMTLSDAFDGMKMRNVKNTPEVIINGDMKRKSKADDDLKWVEENIPTSAADAVLPSVLDSDEELMTTKFEMSKME